jgi:glycosyltransferase
LDNIISVNNQTYSKIEHVFVDGKSSDKTIEIIKSNSSVKNIIVSENDDGIYDAMNKGIALSSGEFIMFLNSDDILCSNDIIEYFMNKIKKYSLDVVYGNVSFFKDDPLKAERIWVSSVFNRNNLKKGFHPPHPGLIVSKKYFNEVGEFNTDYKIVSDYDFMLRLFKQPDIKVKFIDTIIVNMRLGGASTTIKGIFSSFFEFIAVLKSNNYSNYNVFIILLNRYLLKIKQVLFI